MELKYAARTLVKSPAFTLPAVLTLSVGIGASVAIYSIVDTVLLQPLPYTDPSRLVALWTVSQESVGSPTPTGYGDIETWQQSTRTFTGLAAYDGASVVIDDPSGHARRETAVYVSPNVFDVLGVHPTQGRAFTRTEAERRDPLVVISDDFWKEHFGEGSEAIGAGIVINGGSYRVSGVMPPGFRSPDPGSDIIIPNTLLPDWDQEKIERGPDAWRVIGRLAPGVSIGEARSEFDGISNRLRQDFPETHRDLGIRLVPLTEAVIGRQLQLALLTLVAAVGAVLLTACGNVAGLLLARGTTRQHEFAIRSALGASRPRLIGQLLLENTLLALLAALAGAGIASGALQGLLAYGPNGIPRLEELTLDGSALLFAAGIAVVSAVVSGLQPAMRSTSLDPMTTLRGARGATGSRPGRRLRSVLVTLELGAALALAVATVLLGRSFSRILSVDTGFASDQALIVGLTIPRHRPAEEIFPFLDHLLERVQNVPGIRAAGLSEEVLLDNVYVVPVTTETSALPNDETLNLPLRIDAISPDYFHAVGVPLHEGRIFTATDNEEAPAVVIVNETLAKRLWEEGDAVGRRLRFGDQSGEDDWLTVVGIAGDLRRQGPDQLPIAQAFRPHKQRLSRSINLVVSTEAEPDAIGGILQSVVREVDRSIPVSSVTTLGQSIGERLDSRRFTLALISVFAAIALGLAGIGVFGLMHYSVVRRTDEIGVRLSLGATPARIVWMVFKEGLFLVGAGVALGLVLSAFLLPSLSDLLFGLQPFDPLSIIASILLLAAIALLGCYLPARHAAAVDPVTALRTV